jgi:hypothetical protein
VVRVLIPVIVGVCVVLFLGSFVADRLLRRRRAALLAERAEQGFRAGSSDAIAESQIRAIEHGAGMDRPGGSMS